LTLSPRTAHRQPEVICLRLEPGRTIAGFLREGGWPMVVNVLGNLAAFVPLGILWPMLRRGRTTAARVAGLSAAVSFLIESLQFASRRRVADVDDVILNALGGLIGYAAYRLACSACKALSARRLQGRSSGTGNGG
jgi:glycopeptide antibiotics resistance protein